MNTPCSCHRRQVNRSQSPGERPRYILCLHTSGVLMKACVAVQSPAEGWGQRGWGWGLSRLLFLLVSNNANQRYKKLILRSSCFLYPYVVSTSYSKTADHTDNGRQLSCVRGFPLDEWESEPEQIINNVTFTVFRKYRQCKHGIYRRRIAFLIRVFLAGFSSGEFFL